MNILKLVPYCAKAIWGGSNLRTKYGKKADFDIAEAWELSGYPEKESIAAEGKYAGKTITEVIATEGKQILGTNSERFDGFPILIKLIDAAKPLSIQVHPDDEIAKKLGADGGKTEMWIICEAEKDAFIYYGVKSEIEPNTFSAAILDGSITEYLNKVPVKKGDTFFIEAGTIHAIGAGITICEVQQTSDTTYRLYDYMRKDANGNMRELHIEKGTVASKLVPPSHFYEEGTLNGKEKVLVECPFFTVSRIETDESVSVNVDEKSFSAFTVTEGSGKITCGEESTLLSKGDTVFVFAGAGETVLDGKMTIIRSRI